MDQLLLNAFSSQLEKWAQLSDKESKVLKEAIRNQSRFEQLSGGDMTDELKGLHRANTERIKVLSQKKRGAGGSIPRWAMDPKASMPTGTTAGPAARSTGFGAKVKDMFRGTGNSNPGHWERRLGRAMSSHPRTAALGLGTLGGASLGAYGGSVSSLGYKLPGGEEERQKALQQAKETGGPISEYTVKNPVRGGMLTGGLMGAAGGLGNALAQGRLKDPALAGLASLVAAGGGLVAADKYLGNKRRAEAKKEAPAPPSKAA